MNGIHLDWSTLTSEDDAIDAQCQEWLARLDAQEATPHD